MKAFPDYRLCLVTVGALGPGHATPGSRDQGWGTSSPHPRSGREPAQGVLGG